MANNRMYLKCMYCGATLPIAKHFMTPYLVTTSINDIDKFFAEHFICGNQYGNCFGLEYEDNEYVPRTAEEIIRNDG